MTTRADIYQAIRNADAAGDSAAVRKLGAYLQTMPANSPAPPPAPARKPFDRAAAQLQADSDAQEAQADNIYQAVGDVVKSTGDTALSMGSQMVLTPAAGVVGAVAAPFVGNDKAADLVRRIQGWGYTPKSDAGKQTAALIQKAGEAADVPGQVVAEKTGSPALGAAVTTALQGGAALADPAVRGAFGSVARSAAYTGSQAVRTGIDAARSVASKPAATSPAGASAAALNSSTADAAALKSAQAYASDNGLNWDSLSADIQKGLTSMAQSSGDFSGLDPQALARQSRLTALGVPATRGQVTRDLTQLTREENISKTDAGAPIRNIMADQDDALHGALDTLRQGTGAQAVTRRGTGQAVDTAMDAKTDLLKSDYQQAYNTAKAQGALADPVDISPLQDWLKNPTNARNAGYLTQAIQDYLPKGADGDPIPGGQININDLEEIRKEAVANQKQPGPAAFYAQQAKDVIGGILDNAGGDLYQQARQKFGAYQDEFARQGRVAKLIDTKGNTTDRAVALEDTTQHVLKSSADEIGTIRQSLTTGGNAATQLNGVKAWQEIQAGVLDALKEAAAGKRAIVGENNQLQFNSSFRDMFSELDKDGKIDAIFNPKQAATLRDIYEATGDVRTKPAGRIAGSDTTPRLLAMLESFGSTLGKVAKVVPVVGDSAAALVQKAYAAGRERATVREATTSPLRDVFDKAEANAKRRQSIGTAGQLSPVMVPLSQLGNRQR